MFSECMAIDIPDNKDLEQKINTIYHVFQVIGLKIKFPKAETMICISNKSWDGKFSLTESEEHLITLYWSVISNLTEKMKNGHGIRFAWVLSPNTATW